MSDHNRPAYRAAEAIYATFKNASYFSTRNAEHRAQMLEGWAEIIEFQLGFSASAMVALDAHAAPCVAPSHAAEAKRAQEALEKRREPLNSFVPVKLAAGETLADYAARATCPNCGGWRSDPGFLRGPTGVTVQCTNHFHEEAPPAL